MNGTTIDQLYIHYHRIPLHYIFHDQTLKKQQHTALYECVVASSELNKYFSSDQFCSCHNDLLSSADLLSSLQMHN